MMASEMIETLRPDGRKGVMMPKNHYDVLVSFVLSALEIDDTFTLHRLLEHAQEEIAESLDSDPSWYVLQIKLDLEARGYIKAITPPYKKRLFVLKITRQGQKYLRTQKALSELRQA